MTSSQLEQRCEELQRAVEEARGQERVIIADNDDNVDNYNYNDNGYDFPNVLSHFHNDDLADQPTDLTFTMLDLISKCIQYFKRVMKIMGNQVRRRRERRRSSQKEDGKASRKTSLESSALVGRFCSLG